MTEPTPQTTPQSPPAPAPPAGPPQDPAAQQPPASPPAGDPPQEGQGQQEEPLGEGGKKALQAEREARKAAEKAAAEAAARIKEFEDRDKSELQRAQEAQQTAEQQATQAWRDALRTAHQISDEDAETFLTGSDPETLKRQAQRLVELRGTQQQPAPAAAQHTPVEHLRPGAMPNPPEPTQADQIAAAEKQGDFATARQLKTQQLLGLTKQNNS
ncbi:hypothetical protein F4561_006566 [Lipingzhangella halophila]|uniref:Scaffolding protein n=1 Tax=Lipingzhangella halophila TaxID=1783352 RepID=A0A7W7RP74_9ACTN|nr:hypothetical protein [Lipingzhangella halophila]MBB4935657.1 hypothetical protein [Lipingzhangella halophila]